MRRFVFHLVSLSVFHNSAYSAQPRGKTAKSPRSEHSLTVAVLPQNVFDLTEIPAHYRKGVNLADVIRQLEALDSLTKGEFERSDEFHARQEAALDVSALAPSKGQLGFVVDGSLAGLRFAYDADTSQYQITENGGYHPFCQSTPFLALPKGTPSTHLCIVGILNHEKTTYNGQNAFGISAEVDRERGTYVSISIPFANPFFEQYHDSIYNFNDTVNFPSDQARKYRSSDLRMMLVGRISGINTIEGESKITQPRIDHAHDIFIRNKGVPFKPEAIVYFFASDGKILALRDLRESSKQL